jgi:PTS system nitrogen regulatory IIA component
MNLSVKDAARLLSVSEKTIYRWIKQDIVPVYKIHESYRFKRAELVEWATSRRRGVSPEAFVEPESGAQPLPSLADVLERGGVFYRIEGRTTHAVLLDVVNHLRLPEEVDRDELCRALIAREEQASTGIGAGIAISHPLNPVLVEVSQPSLTLCFLEDPVDFKAFDGQPVRVLFTLVAPTLRMHFHLLSKLSFVLKNRLFMDELQSEASREALFAALQKAELDLCDTLAGL